MVDWIERLLPPEEGEEEEDVFLREAGRVPPAPEEKTETEEETAPEVRVGGPAAGEAAQSPRPRGEGTQETWEVERQAGALWETGALKEAPGEARKDGLPGVFPPPRGEEAGLSRTGARRDAGLEALYRETAEAARPGPAPAPAAAAAAGAVRIREAEGGDGLTAEELDRAVRRDSRRYDGGMSIF